ncbi:MAG: hypothetical protein GQ564_15035 [Bacteroidales bacterium]|nr:hypothetical protein [Bacteroidales bacterium]
MEIFGMTINEILVVLALFLIVIDIFFASDVPTHVAYVLLTIRFAKEIDMSILYQLLFGVLIWFALVAFHYTLWRKVIEKINDKFISPRKHTGGIDGLVGKEGIIKEVEGEIFISIHDELHQFETETDKEVKVGDKCIVLKTKSNRLLI